MTAQLENTQDLAGEYVLGTLSAARRQDVEQRVADDAVLRSAVQAWQDRLLPLTALAEPVSPSAQLWGRIESSVEQAGRKSAARRVEVPPVRRGWWESVNLWRSLAGTGFAAAAVMAAVLVARDDALPAGPHYMVVLVAPQDKAPGWVIQASGQNGKQQLSLIPLGRVEVPVEKSLQFWTKGENWGAPVSLGLVKSGQTIQIPLDKLPPLQPNQLFELTLEPVNGSPIGKPTGPIQFIGRAVKVA